jgi:hypothetical protein
VIAAALFSMTTSLQQLYFFTLGLSSFCFGPHAELTDSPHQEAAANLNLADTSTTAKMGHEDAVYLAKLAEQAERYEGMYSWIPSKTTIDADTRPAHRDG